MEDFDVEGFDVNDGVVGGGSLYDEDKFWIICLCDYIWWVMIFYYLFFMLLYGYIIIWLIVMIVKILIVFIGFIGVGKMELSFCIVEYFKMSIILFDFW